MYLFWNRKSIFLIYFKVGMYFEIFSNDSLEVINVFFILFSNFCKIFRIVLEEIILLFVGME